MFRLALSLGKTVAQLRTDLGTIDGIPEEYFWMAFHNLEPFGQDNWHRANIAAQVCNQWASRRLKAEDFLPVRRLKERQSPEVMAKRFRALPGVKFIDTR